CGHNGRMEKLSHRALTSVALGGRLMELRNSRDSADDFNRIRNGGYAAMCRLREPLSMPGRWRGTCFLIGTAEFVHGLRRGIDAIE
ncbi:MAG: hypothetical protein WBD97_22685, partial [Pseudolabrys sp.]